MPRNRNMLIASRIAMLALLCDGVPHAPPPTCQALIACSVDNYEGTATIEGDDDDTPDNR